MEVHRLIGIIPIANDAETFKFFALNIEPASGVFTAARAKFATRHIVFAAAFTAKFFFDFPFNWQAVAIPARHIMRVIAEHLMGAVDDVFKDFIQRRSHMDMTIGIWRAVMQRIGRLAFALLAQLFKQADFVPKL